jgi:hypothetical protein
MSAGNTPQTPDNNSTRLTADKAPPAAGGSFASYDPSASQQPAYYGFTSRTSHRPTSEQLARDEARRRYLRRNVYAPIIIAALVVLVLFALLVYLGFVVQTPEAASFIAGLSALTIIFISLPLIVLMSISPIIWLAFTLNRRQSRRNAPETGPMAYRSRVQILLWQLDSLLVMAQNSAAQVGATLRRPLITLYARVAYLREMAHGIRSRFLRSI